MFKFAKSGLGIGIGVGRVRVGIRVLVVFLRPGLRLLCENCSRPLLDCCKWNQSFTKDKIADVVTTRHSCVDGL